MRMPWGKYAGKWLDEIPLGYLGWLLEEARFLQPELREAIKVEIEDRLDLAPARGQKAVIPQALRPWAAEIIETGFRHAARKHHPTWAAVMPPCGTCWRLGNACKRGSADRPPRPPTARSRAVRKFRGSSVPQLPFGGGGGF
jgi:hypothetical protein